MRQSIDTAPRAGEDIRVEDATVNVAHWSPEASKWDCKDGSPINIAPGHEYPIAEDVPQEGEQVRSSLAVFLMPVVVLGAALLGVFEPFTTATIPEVTRLEGESANGLDRRPEIAPGSQALLQREVPGALNPMLPLSMVRPRPHPEDDALRSDTRASELAGVRSAPGVLTNNSDSQADQFRLAAATTAELRQSLQQEREKSTSLTSKLENVRAQLETTVALSSNGYDGAIRRAQAAEVAAEELRQSLQREQARSAALGEELAGTQRKIEMLDAQSRNADDLATQQRDAAARETAELQHSLQLERERSAALAEKAKAAQAATASAEQQRHEAQSRAAALASELAGIPRETADKATAERYDAAAREIAELRQSLQQEQQKSAVLMTEAKAAQTVTANAEHQRRALDEAQGRAAALASELTAAGREIETRNVQLREKDDAASQQKQAADREIAELRQSLQKERSRTESMERELASASRHTDQPASLEQTIENPILPATQDGEAIAAEPPVASDQGKVAARLILRARALLDQGNIGAARVVLELAAEKDNAQATFMLAETYDPAVLSSWGAYGTRSEAAKARELYAKAQRSGIREATARLEALRP